MKRRLLLDSEVIVLLQALPSNTRRRIWRRLEELAEAPDRFEDFRELDSTGRSLPVHLFCGYSILYWDDLADRHLMVLEITNADG